MEKSKVNSLHVFTLKLFPDYLFLLRPITDKQTLQTCRPSPLIDSLKLVVLLASKILRGPPLLNWVATSAITLSGRYRAIFIQRTIYICIHFNNAATIVCLGTTCPYSPVREVRDDTYWLVRNETINLDRRERTINQVEIHIACCNGEKNFTKIIFNSWRENNMIDNRNRLIDEIYDELTLCVMQRIVTCYVLQKIRDDKK